MEKMINPKERKKLDSWKRKYEEAKLAYSDDISAMKTCTNMYDGDRAVNGNPNKSVTPKKVSINVRNITYELIESQVDSSIPMPKVIPIHKEDEKLAQDIETALQNEIRLLHFNELNDKQERIVPIIGGDFMHVEWDNTKGFHCTVGGISVSERHPKFVIPQPGVTEIDDMDYIFIQIPQTKAFVKAKYNVARFVRHKASKRIMIYCMIPSICFEPLLQTSIAYKISTDGRTVVKFHLHVRKDPYICMMIVKTLQLPCPTSPCNHFFQLSFNPHINISTLPHSSKNLFRFLDGGAMILGFFCMERCTGRCTIKLRKCLSLKKAACEATLRQPPAQFSTPFVQHLILPLYL